MLPCKLLICARPIAHFGHPFFKSWLKACRDPDFSSQYVDLLDECQCTFNQTFCLTMQPLNGNKDCDIQDHDMFNLELL